MAGRDFGVQIDPVLRAEYEKHPWNLNNLPVVRDSVLCYMGVGISGNCCPGAVIEKRKFVRKY